MPVPCHRAGLSPMHDVSLESLRKYATPPLWSCLGSCVELSVLVLELVVVCGPCLQADQRIVPCSIVSVVGFVPPWP
jgi:hypothetical protein